MAHQPQRQNPEASEARHSAEAEMIANAAARLTLKQFDQEDLPKDVIIAVMGVTGTGKSTFIDHLTKSGVKVGHSLQSCTTEVGIHSFIYAAERTIYLLDTPGFNDTNRTDSQVLEEVAYFLGATYSKNIKLAGIIYLHRVTDVRMEGSALRNLSLFQALCGKNSLGNVVLATTMWDKLRDQESVQRGYSVEAELENTDGFWGDMIDGGSKTFRHDNTYLSALHIVDYIMSRTAPVVLDIQREMIDEHQTLDQTTAGQEVQKEILKVKRQYLEELRQTQESMKAALDAGDQRMAQKLARMQDDYETKIKSQDQERLQLKADFEKIQKDKDEKYNKIISELRVQSKKYHEEAQENLQQLKHIKSRQEQSEKEFEALRSESKQNEANWQAETKQREERYALEQKTFQEEIERKNKELLENAGNNNAAAALLGVLTGAAVMMVGALHLNPVMVGAGGAIMTGAGAAIGTGN